MIPTTTRRLGAVAVAAMLLAACSTAASGRAVEIDAQPVSSRSAQGVTADTIKVGFSYIDLEALAKTGIIKIDHGPYADIVEALVAGVNRRGGVNGRRLELSLAKYSAIGSTDQLAACTKLTEDDGVFVVLNGFLGANNLCVVQQHESALVGGSTTALTPANLAAAKAPWVSDAASSRRSIKALVQLLDDQGRLQGKTIGVYGAQVGNQPLVAAGVRQLKRAGYKVAVSALNDSPDDDAQAAAAQDKTIALRMQDAGVDVVVDVTQFIPGANFDAAGFHPALYVLDVGSIAAGTFTNPFGKFPIVAGLSNGTKVGDELRTPAGKQCAADYKRASGKVVKNILQEDRLGHSTGNVALRIACTDLQIFVAGAKAAGKTLDDDTFRTGIESLGSMQLASGAQAYFGPGSLAGQVSFQLQKFDPNWKEGSGKPQFTDLGAEVTVKGA